MMRSTQRRESKLELIDEKSRKEEREIAMHEMRGLGWRGELDQTSVVADGRSKIQHIKQLSKNPPCHSSMAAPFNNTRSPPTPHVFFLDEADIFMFKAI